MSLLSLTLKIFHRRVHRASTGDVDDRYWLLSTDQVMLCARVFSASSTVGISSSVLTFGTKSSVFVPVPIGPSKFLYPRHSLLALPVFIPFDILVKPCAPAHESTDMISSGHFPFYTRNTTTCTVRRSAYWEDFSVLCCLEPPLSQGLIQPPSTSSFYPHTRPTRLFTKCDFFSSVNWACTGFPYMAIGMSCQSSATATTVCGFRI